MFVSSFTDVESSLWLALSLFVSYLSNSLFGLYGSTDGQRRGSYMDFLMY